MSTTIFVISVVALFAARLDVRPMARSLLDGLPAYHARIAKTGGYW